MTDESIESLGSSDLRSRRRARLGAVGPITRKRLLRWLLPSGALLLVLLFMALGTGYSYGSYDHSARTMTEAASELPAEPAARKKLETQMQKKQRQLLSSLQQKAPRGTYVVIDQTQNRLYLKKNEEVLLEAVCSAGSGYILEEGEGGRRWVFDTPRGQYKVLNRISNPIWKKPDWAFVEEGKPIPKDPNERFEAGVLGEYALYFGNGYMIHGTLYERLLGRSVTHGCIRLGRENLRAVWESAPIGTPIYIY